jgi:Fe2+ transport system protein B
MEIAAGKVKASLRKRGLKINAKKTILTAKKQEVVKKLSIGGEEVKHREWKQSHQISRGMDKYESRLVSSNQKNKKNNKNRNKQNQKNYVHNKITGFPINIVLIPTILYATSFFKMSKTDVKNINGSITQMVNSLQKQLPTWQHVDYG